MSPDNAEYAGPWRLLDWPALALPGACWIRVAHVTLGRDVIDLSGPDWACAAHEFQNDAATLHLALVNLATSQRCSGSVDMNRGTWLPAGEAAPLAIEQFHRLYSGTLIASWPDDPFRHVHPPSALDVRSPDGRYAVDLTTNRWKMSDWIHPPRVVVVATGDALLDLRTTYWDARARFLAPAVVELTLLRYPAVEPSLVVELDLDAEQYRVTAGGDGISPSGCLDELQSALGRSPADLKELGQPVNVRPSRRTAKPSAAAATSPSPTPPPAPAAPGINPQLSGDGQFEVQADPPGHDPASRPPALLSRMRVRHPVTGAAPLDLSRTAWLVTASWISTTNTLRLTVHDASAAPRLTVKVDFDCMLYWEEHGPDFGLPGNQPVQAAPLWELQERLTLEPHVIRPAERSPETGMMWPSRAFRAAPPPKPAAAAPPSAAPIRTLVSPCGTWRVELFPSGRTTQAADGATRPYYFARFTRSSGGLLIDTRRTRHLVWVMEPDAQVLQLSRQPNDEEWIAVDLASGSFCWENFREPTSATEPLEALPAELSK